MIKKTVIMFFGIAMIASAQVMALDQKAGKDEFGGTGLSIAQLYDQESKNHRGNIVVLHVLPNSPALAQGIEKGDIITHVDNVALAGKTFEEIVLKKMRGSVGSTIELTIKRDGRDTPLKVNMKREKVTWPLQPKHKQ